jgi:release factor glutamine methyltransferase
MDGLANTADGSGARGVRDALIFAIAHLTAAGIDSPRLDAEILLAFCLNMSREQLVVAAEMTLSPTAARHFYNLVERRLRREPVAYITSKQEFWSLDFAVSPDVLIPRSDTERLVEVVLLCAAKFSPETPLRIAELCTGSGAVAVSLARELPLAQIDATDVSPAALAIARRNAEAHQVAARMRFLAGDLFSAWAAVSAPRFDLIVANPPYVRRHELPTLAPEVNRWEPITALDGGIDGVDFYRRIVAGAPDYLAEAGTLVLEIGDDMATAIATLCADSGSFPHVEVFQDYAGRDRVIKAQLPKP